MASRLERPKEVHPIPDTLKWDLFLGPAKERPYNPIYTPWNWRGWWDFGTGALGDMACHILDPIFMSLKLKYPIKVQGSSSLFNTESPPLAEVVNIHFRHERNSETLKCLKLLLHGGTVACCLHALRNCQTAK